MLVTGCFGKLIDTVLVDNHPVGQADLFALKFFCILDGFYCVHVASGSKAALSDT